MTTEPEHLDPEHLPPWLAEAAMKTHPEAMGWLAAGYLAGVAVGKKTGPCMARVDSLIVGGYPISCELAHGHMGGHRSDQGVKWIDVGEQDED